MDKKVKEYIENPMVRTEMNGEVILIEQLNNLTYPESVHLEQNLFIMCEKGHMDMDTGTHTLHLQAGQICILPSSKTIGDFKATDDMGATILAISDRVLRSLLGPQADIWNNAMYLRREHVIDSEWSYGLRHHIAPLFEAADTLILHREIILSFLRTFILLICEQLCKTLEAAERKPTPQRPPRDNVIFNDFLSLLAETKVKKHSVAYYAEQLCITPKYLCTICSHSSGKSPSQWIMEYVMEDIYVALKYTTKSMKEIANELGFSNNSFFGKYFREHAGMTPSEYRQRMLKVGEDEHKKGKEKA